MPRMGGRAYEAMPEKRKIMFMFYHSYVDEIKSLNSFNESPPKLVFRNPSFKIEMQFKL